MDLQVFQLDAMAGNQKEAFNNRGACILETRSSKVESLQSRQGHGKLGDVAVVQPEGALGLPVFAAAVVPYTQIDQVLKHSNWGDEGSIDNGHGGVFGVQRLQRFLHLGKWCHVLPGGNSVLNIEAGKAIRVQHHPRV